VARRHAAVEGGARLPLQVEHGVDERLPALRRARADLPEVPLRPADLLADVRVQRAFILPISHDEVVHGKRSLLDKMPGDEWQKFANLRLALGFMWAHPGKQLLFMGTEIGQWREWSEAGPLDWELLEWPLHRGAQQWVRDLNRVYREEPALWQRDATYEGFEWIDFHDVENSVVIFRRVGVDPANDLVVVCATSPRCRGNP
jgi:1,4-alpha-glucan branching enzyme